MNNDIGGVSSIGTKQKKSHRKPSKTCVGIVLVMISLVVSVPFVYSQLNPHQDLVNTITFVLESPNSSWCTGEGRIWFEDEGFELLSPWPAIFKQSILSDSNVWQALMPVERHFSEPVTCNLEYTCTVLNMTIGPLSFNSDQYRTLYIDGSGNMIYLSVGHIGSE